MSHRVIIALGSNTQQEANIRLAVDHLLPLLGPAVRYSPALWTDPIGIQSDRFLNLILVGHTDQDATAFVKLLKTLEQDMGRRKGYCTLDADLLAYDEQRFHESDWQRPYIQQLLKTLLL